MKVAVLSLTRDRLAYTQRCFASLQENAGCKFDHYVLDQDSEDETRDWLDDELFAGRLVGWMTEGENIGISRGHNLLLDNFTEDYDVVCTFDNDCEVTMPRTLAACAKIAGRGDWIVSPTVNGLNFPPRPGPTVWVDGEPIGPFPEMGGIFRCMPGEFARTFRFNESNPLWGWDERDVGRVVQERGMGSGYLLDWSVNHYKTTKGQEAELGPYFARKFAEMT
jgi:hypothetical protein